MFDTSNGAPVQQRNTESFHWSKDLQSPHYLGTPQLGALIFRWLGWDSKEPITHMSIGFSPLWREWTLGWAAKNCSTLLAGKSHTKSLRMVTMTWMGRDNCQASRRVSGRPVMNSGPCNTEAECSLTKTWRTIRLHRIHVRFIHMCISTLTPLM